MDDLANLTSALAGRYDIERELGAGGMATVYLAHDVRHGRRVALKVLRPELGAALGVQRFLAEIRVTARLQHPNVLPLFDSGEAGGLLFYVMPFVEGGSLRQRLDRDKQLPVDEATGIAIAMARALDYAHAHGVIHRDLKPENILLQSGQPMLADFGIALAAATAPDKRLTATGLMVGTPAYMSPEQAAGERELGARSDVYSLGCVLHELLAGEPPFNADSAQAMIAMRFSDAAPLVRRARPAVPPHVEQALVKALALEPADRFDSASAFAAALASPGAAVAIAPSVAVLPFDSLSTDPENEYFADGITEDVTAQLSKIRSLKVISRTSVMQFKRRVQSVSEIAATLRVAAVLEGSVRRVGDRVRIVAQLIDAASDRHLWTETYDRQLTDIFAIQSEVALRIAGALKAELSPGERARVERPAASDVLAYQLYLQGRSHLNRYDNESVQRAIGFFERAAERDGGMAAPHVGLAYAFADMAETGVMSPELAHPRAMDEAMRALALDPDLADAHCAVAYLKMIYQFDWSGSEEGFKRALELNPNGADAYDLYGRLCAALERHDEAIALEQRARELDPLVHRVDLATALLRAGRNDEALAAAQHAVSVDPDYARAHSTLGWACLRAGRTAEGLAELERAVALAPANAIWLAQLGEAYAQAGQPAKAREILHQLQQQSAGGYVSPYHLAYVYTGLGERDRALDCLEDALQHRAGALYGIKGSFLFASLREMPRFQALLRKMRLA